MLRMIDSIPDPMYCVRGGCGEVATHLVTQRSRQTNQVLQTVAACWFHAPAFIMGCREDVYARFVEVA